MEPAGVALWRCQALQPQSSIRWTVAGEPEMREVLMKVYRRRRKRIREQKILAHVDLGRAGLEIGPSHLPIVAKKNGFRVKVLDHTTADELRLKYRADGVNLDLFGRGCTPTEARRKRPAVIRNVYAEARNRLA